MKKKLNLKKLANEIDVQLKKETTKSWNKFLNSKDKPLQKRNKNKVIS